MLTIPTFILILNICVFIFGVFLLSKTASNFKRLEIRWLAIFIGALCIISFGGLNVYVQDSLEAKTFYSRFRYLGHAVVAQSWFFFLTTTFSGRHFLHRKWIISLLMIPTIITMSMAIVPSLGPLLSHNYSIIVWESAKLVSSSSGPWFKFHIIWAYLFAMAGIAYTLFMLTSLDRQRRIQILLLLAGGTLSLIVDIYCVVTDSHLRWAMLSGGLYLINEGLILYCILKLGLLNLPHLVKNEIFNKISDPILILDPQNKVIEFNESAASIFSLSKASEGKTFSDIPIFRDIDLKEIKLQWSFLDQNKNIRYFEVIAEKLNALTIQTVKIIRFYEVTTHKINELLLSNNLEFKTRLVSMIAHDFSNVIQAQTILSSGLEQEVAPELRQQAGFLTDSTHLSKDFMNNVLLWANSQQNHFTPVISNYELNTLIREVVNSIESLWRLRGLEIILNSSSPQLLLTGDLTMIESVIRNILTNSIRASSSGQKIEITLETSQHEIKVKLQDEGVGLTQELLSAIKSSTAINYSELGQRPKGFGIGISIAQKFVELHNGKLEFFSEKGSGTLVTLTLPK